MSGVTWPAAISSNRNCLARWSPLHGSDFFFVFILGDMPSKLWCVTEAVVVEQANVNFRLYQPIEPAVNASKKPPSSSVSDCARLTSPSNSVSDSVRLNFPWVQFQIDFSDFILAPDWFHFHFRLLVWKIVKTPYLILVQIGSDWLFRFQIGFRLASDWLQSNFRLVVWKSLKTSYFRLVQIGSDWIQNESLWIFV